MSSDLFHAAMIAYERGRLDEAREHLRALLRASPRHARGLHLLAVVLMLQDAAAEAVEPAKKAASLAPTDPEILCTLGNALAISHRHEEAVHWFRQAVSVDPRNGPAWNGLGQSLTELRAYAHADGAFAKAMELEPTSADPLSGRLWSLLHLGRGAEGVELFRRLPRELSSDVVILNRAAACALHSGAATHDELNSILSRLGAILTAPVTQRLPEIPLTPEDAERPLRVGFLSADYFTHAVMYFFESILEFRDRACFSAHMYSDTPVADETTARVRAYADSWHDCRGMSFQALASRIREDRIDVLVDLVGHYASSRLGVMPYRPAPLQATMIGYPHSTGLTSVDLRIVDSHTDPPGAEQHARERLIRLDPCFLCYRPEHSAPDITPAPPEPLTFCSFNTIAKWSTETLQLWKRVLDAVPRSRLLLKATGLKDRGTHDSVRARLLAAGLDPSRINLVSPQKGLAEHLGTYAKAHLALDTFPYHGTTTTCESLWMGVPVVTLAGETHAARVGVSLLHAAGLPEFIARTPEEYVRIATHWAQNHEARHRLRLELRARLQASVLLDGRAYAARWEHAIRAAWRERCGIKAFG